MISSALLSILAMLAVLPKQLCCCVQNDELLELTKASLDLATVMIPTAVKISTINLMCQEEASDVETKALNEFVSHVNEDQSLFIGIHLDIQNITSETWDIRSLLIIGDETYCKGNYLALGKINRRLMLIPKSCYSEKIELKLDSQIILYQDMGKSILFEEVYAIKRSKPIISRLGWWSFERQSLLLTRDVHIWERRKNLMGAILLNMHMDYEPLHYFSKDGEYKGAMLEMLQALEKALNFTTKFVEPSDGSWGGNAENGKL